LLYEGALRLQDAVGLTFGDIVKRKPDKYGERRITTAAKKTDSRKISIPSEVYEAVKRYQQALGAKDSQVMFEPSKGKEPTNRWVHAIERFFEKHSLEVTSHDFRTTFITSLYNKTKDIALVQNFVGHKLIETTRGYVKIKDEKVTQAVRELRMSQSQTKR
jgi:integrase